MLKSFHPFLFGLILTAAFAAKTSAQGSSAVLSGKITDDNHLPVPNASVIILGRQSGIVSNDSGMFRLRVPANKAFAVVISHAGYKTVQNNFLLRENSEETIKISLERDRSNLDEVIITEQTQRNEAGLIAIDPSDAANLPSPVGGIEGLIKIFVGSNNELTSQYSVRGGNYDENLIYVNDFEVFRPYLVRSGQQEGLSFINPDMVKNVKFYNGGFQAKYGDKMSSVLDVQYKKPAAQAGSAYISLLEQGIHYEGVSKNKKFSYIAGMRNRSNRNILSSQETQGNYVPSSSDLQAVLSYSFNERSSIEFLGNVSATRFTLIPEFSQLTASVITQHFVSNLGLDIYFEGREKDSYRTNMLGLSFIHHPRKALSLKWMVSRFSNDEIETIDIAGAYLFGDRGFDKTKSDFGLIINPLGAGLNQTFARNDLNINVWNASHKGSLDLGRHYLQWGQSVEYQTIKDKLHEWEYQDSAGYNIPYNPQRIEMSRYTSSKASFDVTRISGYIQNNFLAAASFTLQGGVRYNYNTLNNELLVAPRLGFSWTPSHWKPDIVFRGAVGAYHQPPFYRELRRYDGSLNKELKSQKSYQASAGFDYQFRSGRRPYRLTTEAYYKKMWDVVPYDIDNVRIRYAGENNAKAYATGLEMRLYSELVKDAESWLSLGFMGTRENIKNDFYYDYLLNDQNQPIDSTLKEGGWFRRPTDRTITFGMFLQDYLATNKNFRVYLNFLYGSNLPYNVPGSVKYRNAFKIEPYIRIDIGFSAILFDKEVAKLREHSPFNAFNKIWATLEVFNLIDRDNTISYLLIKDFSNTVFALPNRLTPRLLNLKLLARF